MNFSDFEAHVRAGMDDAISARIDTNAEWKTTEVARYLNDAIADYSQYFPRKKTASITVVAGTREYDLPLDIIQPPDTAIEDAVWQRTAYGRDHLQRLEWSPGASESISVSGTGKGYMIWGSLFILTDAPSVTNAGYPITLYYHALHEQCNPVANEELYSFQLTIPEADRSLMFWYVTGVMMGKLEASDASLRRWAEKSDGGSNRDDSPPRKSANWRMNKYEHDVYLRLNRKAPTKMHKGTR